jgi:predicted dehydrogenase
MEAGNARVEFVARVSEHAMSDNRARDYVRSVTRVDSWQKVSECPVDAVVVATPPDSHEEICEHFLSKGIPVMVEKPMALTVGAALAIKDAASKTGAPVLINNVHLFAPAYGVLREKVQALSDRRFRVYARAGSSGPHRSYSALWDYGPHDVAMCLGLGLGNPTGVTCMRMPDEFGCVHLGAQRFDVNVSFGRHEANIQVWNGALPKQRHFEVICEGTRLVYDELEPNGLVLRCNNRPLDVSKDRPLACAVRAFAEAVRTGVTDWRFGAEIGVVTTRILHTADTGTVHA